MPTISEMIERHNEIKVYLEKEAMGYAERMKPYNEAMGVIEQVILGMLNKEFPDLNGPASFKCEAGTAYRSRTLSVRVTDKQAFTDFILDGHMEFLDARVLKEPVKEWREANHADPPGVTSDPVIKCNIRRT